MSTVLSQVTLYVTCEVMAGVTMVLETPQEDAATVELTPGPVTVQEVVTPVAESVRVLVWPLRTRVGAAVRVADGAPQPAT